MTDALIEAAIAANRFGLGARPGEIARIAADPKSWLLRQLQSAAIVPEVMQGLKATPTYTREFEDRVRARRRDGRDPGNEEVEAKDGAAMFREAFRDDVLGEIAARGRAAVESEQPFLERLSRFWANHFAVSGDKPEIAALAGAFEREAIRPHVLGSFADLLLAAESHPAMLRFLDNSRSIGPDSSLVKHPPRRLRRRAERSGQPLKLGINENLAREILELHTLGVEGGYTQDDVIELSQALTGWSVETRLMPGGDAIGPHGFVFRADIHQPGPRKLLGKSYAAGGVEQATAMLRDLARHPSTGRFLATKLARHFASDRAPSNLVDRLERAYLHHDGDLVHVYRALVEAPECWVPEPQKFKRPAEFLVSGMRATGLPFPPKATAWAAPLTIMGQRPFVPGSPAGWPDTADAWIGADALWKRVLVAERMAEHLPAAFEPMILARDALGPRLSAATTAALARAESPQQAGALFLASPEFQWR